MSSIIVELLKKIRGGAIKKITGFQIPFAGSVCNLEYEEAIEYLQKRSKKPNGIVEVHNRLNPQYDLQIIIPAYNAEKYIEKCLNSILSQKTQYTYVITVINDGSTDETSQILSKYLDDEHIDIISQSNKGFSGARNRGLKNLVGHYLMFVDSDDWICEDAIEKLMNKSIEWDADIVEGSVLFVDDNGRTLSRKHHFSSCGDKDYEETLWGQPWGKVIRATVFENLCFPEGFWYEDSIFEYCIYPFWKKKYTIENDVYAYRYNLNGITYKSRGNVKSIDHYWIMLYLWDWIKDKQILRSDEWLQISMLDNMVLGYLRTKDLDEKTVQSGFVVLRKRYLSSFANPPRQQNKYILLDKSLRKKDFGQFKLLCDRWRYL